MRENKPSFDEYKWLRENEVYRFNHNHQIMGATPTIIGYGLVGTLAGAGAGAVVSGLRSKKKLSGAGIGSLVGAGVGLAASGAKYLIRRAELRKLAKMTPEQRDDYYKYKYHKVYGN